MSTDALVSLAALEVACDEGVSPHLARLDDALSRANGPDRAVLGCVREVLSLHLELLIRRPDALWPVLYAHAAFVDSAAARQFGLTPGPDQPLHHQVHRWWAERRGLHPGQPWLRALVPTTSGGTLVAELRKLARPIVKRVSAHARVGAPGEGSGALQVDVESEGRRWRWDVQRGAVHAVDTPTPIPHALVRPASGGLAVKRGAQLEWLLEPAWQVEVLELSDDGSRAVCCANDIDETLGFVFELPSGRQLTSFTPSRPVVGLSPSGSYVAFGRGSLTVVLEVSSGRERFVSRNSRVTSLAVDESGEWVAHEEDGAVRLHRATASAREPPLAGGLNATFSRDGSVLALGAFLLSGADGAVLARHEHGEGGWLEGGPPPNGLRVTAERLCVSEPFFTEIVEMRSGATVRLAVRANQSHRVAWSGDGRVFARVRRADSTIDFATRDRQWTVEARQPITDLALDFTGSQLALLLGDGTVQLQAGGTRLRQLPGATSLAFLANDSALAVGGPNATVVLGLDGSERWRSNDRFSANEQRCAEVEWQSGLRSPSLAESLGASFHDGLLTVSLGPRHAPFPSRNGVIVPSPRNGLFVNGLTLLKWEPE